MYLRRRRGQPTGPVTASLSFSRVSRRAWAVDSQHSFCTLILGMPLLWGLPCLSPRLNYTISSVSSGQARLHLLLLRSRRWATAIGLDSTGPYQRSDERCTRPITHRLLTDSIGVLIASQNPDAPTAARLSLMFINALGFDVCWTSFVTVQHYYTLSKSSITMGRLIRLDCTDGVSRNHQQGQKEQTLPWVEHGTAR
ncbi:hypothetical protein DFH09DRAFT_1353661 [Mycena vulgaris]|nr:hypothetical protein DFH09DRAFT_1353661 [Mycena vulgaris]